MARVVAGDANVIDWPELPDWGAYLQWPQDGVQWIHPEDVALVQTLVPSNRVFLRDHFDGTYYTLSYGDIRIRVKPTLWTKLEDDGLKIGDSVEVISVNLERDPIIASVAEKRFETDLQRIGYTLVQRELPLDRIYYRDELKNLTPHIELQESDGNLVRPVPEDIEIDDMGKLL